MVQCGKRNHTQCLFTFSYYYKLGDQQMLEEALSWILENADLILLLVSIFFAIVAKYFATQYKEIEEAAVAVITLSMVVLESVKDKVVSGEELKKIVEAIEIAQKELQDVWDMVFPKEPVTPVAGLVMAFRGTPKKMLAKRISGMSQALAMKK